MSEFQQTEQTVRPLFTPQQPKEEPKNFRAEAQMIQAVLGAAWNICSARLLGMVALVGALCMFGYAVHSPVEWRVYAAAAYAVLVMLPIVILYSRRG